MQRYVKWEARLLGVVALVCLCAAPMLTVEARQEVTATKPRPRPAKPSADLVIHGEDKVAGGRLIRLEATGARPSAGLLWMVTPRGKVDQADTDSTMFQAAAPAGEYLVDLIEFYYDPDSKRTDVRTATRRITVGNPPTGPPTTDPPKVDPPDVDPPTAGGKLYFMAVRPDGPALPAFTKVMAMPAWRKLEAAGHLVKDKTASEAKAWIAVPADKLPVVVVLTISEDGRSSTVAAGPVPLPSTEAEILALPNLVK